MYYWERPKLEEIDISYSFQMYYWERTKLEEIDIVATYLEMLHINLTVKTTLNDPNDLCIYRMKFQYTQQFFIERKMLF